MPAKYTKWTNIWKFLTILDSSQLEVFLEFFLFFKFKFGPICNRSVSEPVWPVNAVTGHLVTTLQKSLRWRYFTWAPAAGETLRRWAGEAECFSFLFFEKTEAEFSFLLLLRACAEVHGRLTSGAWSSKRRLEPRVELPCAGAGGLARVAISTAAHDWSRKTENGLCTHHFYS